jgi:hypothetical protein
MSGVAHYRSLDRLMYHVSELQTSPATAVCAAPSCAMRRLHSKAHPGHSTNASGVISRRDMIF